MVKRKKHDKDKYYNLARQQGYRARSAFKLIQLNKKYDFLSKAKVCIDLCAAPGGWCQVAAKYMPASSIILGIDLLPIRPIRGVKTYQCDITTARCRQIIRQEMQSWNADVVLCDGAPNVGAEYSKDAYVQNELALIALKLAVDVMGKGATFVSKVFRSQDYNALVWVFKQLFKKVSATKPLSSRNESAEIFVVCEDYLAPHSIDPKLLDPEHVFSQLEKEAEGGLTIFHPKYGQQKRHREGYDDDLGQTLTRVKSISDFVSSTDPIRLLTDCTSFTFAEGDDMFRDHAATTAEIKLCLSDLKVLGKGDFKNLLKWRTKMQTYRDELLKAAKGEEEAAEEEAVVATIQANVEMTEEEKNAAIREELAQLRANVLAKKKREKKKEREKKAKERLRAAMGMSEAGIELTDDAQAFSLKKLGLAKSNLNDLDDGAYASASDSDELLEPEHDGNDDDDDDMDAVMESQMEKLYDEYLTRKGEGAKTKKAVKRSKIAKRALAGEALVEDHTMFDGDNEAYNKMLNPEESSDESDAEENPLVVSLKQPTRPSAAVSRWFSGNKLFEDVKDTPAVTVDKDGDVVPVMPLTDKEIRHKKRKEAAERKERRAAKKQRLEDEELARLASDDEDMDAGPNDEDDKKGAKAPLSAEQLKRKHEKEALIKAGMGAPLLAAPLSTNFEVVKADPELPVADTRKYDSDNEDYDAEDHARTMALAHMMLKRDTAKDLIDNSYNRYAWNDTAELPDWFVDDEERHYRPQIPVPKHLMAQMKERFMEMATKPVKKVAEARARKQRQQLKKVKIAKKKANDIANLPDMSTREKLKAIDKAMKMAKTKKESKLYVVSRRGRSAANSKSFRKGDKGQTKVVDPRMKKDKRNAEKRSKRGRK
ncbi:rRNA methyltransferase [Achlya hypogyna]|uniref:Putative rRNA methyltransferase n=1 Tax=Achlya hypogyna TaxID=1202772 RepID=A0A1V9YFP0_ACHHY|nr:rRNA methyltransferase [Achlya hypogyna]